MQIIESLYNYKKSKVKNLTAERDSNYYDQAIEKNDEAYVQALSFNQFPPQIQQYYKHSHEDC